MSGDKSTMAGAVVDSPVSSCVSSDAEEEVPAPAPAKPMVVVGCPQCLMYVMLSGEEQQPRCPRCKSPVLLHFLHADDDSKKPAGSRR